MSPVPRPDATMIGNFGYRVLSWDTSSSPGRSGKSKIDQREHDPGLVVFRQLQGLGGGRCFDGLEAEFGERIHRDHRDEHLVFNHKRAAAGFLHRQTPILGWNGFKSGKPADADGATA